MKNSTSIRTEKLPNTSNPRRAISFEDEKGNLFKYKKCLDGWTASSGNENGRSRDSYKTFGVKVWRTKKVRADVEGINFVEKVNVQAKRRRGEKGLS